MMDPQLVFASIPVGWRGRINTASSQWYNTHTHSAGLAQAAAASVLAPLALGPLAFPGRQAGRKGSRGASEGRREENSPTIQDGAWLPDLSRACCRVSEQTPGGSQAPVPPCSRHAWSEVVLPPPLLQPL
ncbi:hypothetical protein ElyMa_006326100 [Elysia marginata]|uniref:Uncharacterized protein n=1 Tax=Elysia marginata TaxID=1093978 RepID=A0AAV4HJE3_9GAST|nr:hypothetical protein ElyMa_006326100 [Elysia marginata]